MNVFDLRDAVVNEYADYVGSFITIRDDRIREHVQAEMERGALWPEPLVQLSPAFEPGEPIEELIVQGDLHPLCAAIFRDKPAADQDRGLLRLHRHQVEGIRAARAGHSYVLTTGTGSGKSLAYIVPIVDHVLRRGSGKGIAAIVVYPMNALANSQLGELEKYLCHGFADGKPPVTFRRYTGQESDEDRKAIVANPPDILLTNYVMLELLLTRVDERQLVEAARGLRFLVFDELHTYRGRQGADVAMLIRRVCEATGGDNLIQIGTSATLSGRDTWLGQQEEVSKLATDLFGTDVLPGDVIGETLRRTTTAPWSDTEAERAMLRGRIVCGLSAADGASFRADPLSRWMESTLGLRDDGGRLVRCTPRPLRGPEAAAAALASACGLPESECDRAIREALLAGYRIRDEHGRPIFAFRLHQFVSKGERVYASAEPEDVRYITLQGQQFVPGTERESVLFPVAFCRECGQDYYVVRRVEKKGRPPRYEPRPISERPDDDDIDGGFLFIDTRDPWPQDPAAQLDRLPESWIEHRENAAPRVVQSRRSRLPRPAVVGRDGTEGQGGQLAWFIEAPFLFCLRCRVEYDAHQQSDYGKLATLGTEGRSSATTVLSLTAVRQLRRDTELKPEARKLLSFTDNRQDASLQAGHFNDFVEVVMLRAGLRKAVDAAGSEGLRADDLVQRVFEALALPPETYALNPEAKFAAREESDRALRRVLEYWLFRDLKRGWRLHAPNLEQCGLLHLDYLQLVELCAADGEWQRTPGKDGRPVHEILRLASPEQREIVCRVLLDHLRRELAIRAPILRADEQEKLITQSQHNLNEAWAIDGTELFERSRIAWPRGEQTTDRSKDRGLFISARGGFGTFLRRGTTFPDAPSRLKRDESALVIADLIHILCMVGGFLVEVERPSGPDGVGGYQLNPGMIVWRSGDGQRAFHDPVRVPHAPEDGLRTNPYFVRFYRSPVDDLRALSAREHTAQVPAELREQREEAFRSARLPILFCSPTMELGVDIAQLNVVNLRNVPPTPANYAQRSGRAGRSGQPALISTYCTAGSPHDQYFFKRPERMVGGSVTTPRLDLSNEDLLRAHVHAIWLASVHLDLHRSLAQILDVEGDPPPLLPREFVRKALLDLGARAEARKRAMLALAAPIQSMLQGSGFIGAWVQRVLDELPLSFDRACERWRTLYRTAYATYHRQSKIAVDASRPPEDRDRAKRLRAEAEAQLKLLIAQDGSDHQSDFYSYRYFASEGFLPGYNFPRLPLSAWIPGRRRGVGRDEYLQRPRFLAVAEFGPRSIVYHEGSKFEIHRAMLPISGDDATITRSASQCDACGYLHPIDDTHNPDLCERCGERLPQAMDNLFPMRNVVARRRDRINSDEEERMRLGFEIRTGVRFAERDGGLDKATARLLTPGGDVLAHLEYGASATLWRVNVGPRRRAPDAPPGYLLDEETGAWKSLRAAQADAEDEVRGGRIKRVVPFVEDRRNCLLIRLEGTWPDSVYASLQAALKLAIQDRFQLEDNELAGEPLPSENDRRLILIYEASEGGAGVLRRLVQTIAGEGSIPDLARAALERLHFDPDTGADEKRHKKSREDCVAACYDCLLSYYNQRDHRLLDRQSVRDLLVAWRDGYIESSPRAAARDEHLRSLFALCQSDLERRWLGFIDRGGFALPTHAQRQIGGLLVQPDFLYEKDQVAVFIDGPHHDTADQKKTDAQQEGWLLDAGWTVVRFHHGADWGGVVGRWTSVFGLGNGGDA